MDKRDIVKEKQTKTLTLIEDTRNQVGKHKNVSAYCKRNGIELIRQKLEVGDYMLLQDEAGFWKYPPISVDTKESILEICKNVMSSDHHRFKSEVIRAREMGIQLIVLVEEIPPYGRLDMWEVPRFQNSDRYHRKGDPMTMVHPASLRQALITMQERYGVKFRFCTRRQSPARIIKYLKGELK